MKSDSTNASAATVATVSSFIPFRAGLFESDGDTAQLITSSCATCGRDFFPARSYCIQCGEGGQIAERRIRGEGVIYASTIARVPSPVGLKPPYAYGYVNLDAAKLRVFALFTSIAPEQLRPGTRVEMVTAPLRKDSDGNELVAYKFRPIPVTGETR